jgi:hypothetical protein
LFLSLNTVTWYNRQICDKLRVRSRTQAVARARDLRLPENHQPTDKPEIDRISAEVRAQLEEPLLQREWATGREMTLGRAAAYALQEIA